MATARAEPSPSAAARLQPLPPLRVALGAVARGPCFPPCFTYRQKGAESARPAAARPEQVTATAGKGRPRQTLTARPPPPPKRAVPFISASSPARSELSRSLAPRRPRSRARTPRPPGAGASAEGGRRPAAQSPRAESLLSDVRGGWCGGGEQAPVHSPMHGSGDPLDGEPRVLSPGRLCKPREPTGDYGEHATQARGGGHAPPPRPWHPGTDLVPWSQDRLAACSTWSSGGRLDGSHCHGGGEWSPQSLSEPAMQRGSAGSTETAARPTSPAPPLPGRQLALDARNWPASSRGPRAPGRTTTGTRAPGSLEPSTWSRILSRGQGPSLQPVIQVPSSTVTESVCSLVSLDFTLPSSTWP